MKFAFVSQVLPPSGSGQAIVIYRLLQYLDPNVYCLISRQKLSEDRNEYSRRLRGPYYHLKPELKLVQGDLSGFAKWHRRFNVLLSTVFGLGIFLRGRRIAEIAKRERCEAIVACTGGDLLDIPAGYFASRRLRVPFYAYYFDDYLYAWPSMRFFAKRVESFVIRRAAGVVAPNEFMRDELRRRYGTDSTIIRNPCDLADYESEIDESDSGRATIGIVYTGAIYDAHYDAFRNLLKAIELTGRTDLKLHLYTTFPPAELRSIGITGPVVFHEHQPNQSMPAIQQQADILFLPLAFSSPYPEMIRTSAPGKIAEYLAAAQPILVHAPRDCFVSWYFRQHECGLVVDKQNPEKLAESIQQILGDGELRERLGRRARERARADFDVTMARRTFADLMKLDVASPSHALAFTHTHSS